MSKLSNLTSPKIRRIYMATNGEELGSKLSAFRTDSGGVLVKDTSVPDFPMTFYVHGDVWNKECKRIFGHN